MKTNMTFLSKRTLSVLALSVAAGIGFTGYASVASAAVEGNTDTDFTARLHVVSDNTCTLTVTPPASTRFDFTWTYPGAKPATGVLTYNSGQDNGPIQVVAAGGPTCSLNGIKISGSMSGAPSSGYTDGVYHAQQYPFGSSGGAWGILPMVSRIQLYTDESFTQAATGVVKYIFPDGKQYSQTTSRAGIGGKSCSSACKGSGIGGSGTWLSDLYMYGVLLTQAGTNDSISIITDNLDETYKSANLFIGGAIGSAPINDATGQIDVLAAQDGDAAMMPFTVTITEG